MFFAHLKWIAMVPVLLALPTELSAYTVDPGGGQPSCCLVPPEIAQRAEFLERSFAGTDQEALARQRWAGKLCENHPCDGEVTEDQAKDLLDSYKARRAAGAKAAIEAREKWWDGFQKIPLGLIAFSGLWLGVLNRYRPRS